MERQGAQACAQMSASAHRDATQTVLSTYRFVIEGLET
jgi:hypothetical protein